MNYSLSSQARAELLDIWSYIAADNEPAADRLLEAMKQRFEMLCLQPYAGRSRDYLRMGYRSLAVGQYVIFYRVEKEELRILRVLHGKRNITEIVGDEIQ